MDLSVIEDEMQRDKMIESGMGSCSKIIKREPGISREMATKIMLIERERKIPIGMCLEIGNEVNIETL